ncbi:MAG: IS110 family transposase [Bacteroidetes bacterium]|nr:MAG: IS110 family transposase [Bacteroidota bacterium]
MQKYQKYFGIDVSKNHLDIAQYLPETNTTNYLIRIKNTPEAIETWLKTMDMAESLVCMEHTGLYINFLVMVLHQQKIDTWVENGLQIKRSLGVQKGKNDKIDAQRIAKYAFRCQDECRLYLPCSEVLEKLQVLQHLQNKLKDTLEQYEVPLNESKIFSANTHKLLEKHTEKIITELKKVIKEIETEILECIANDEGLKKKYDLINSVTNVGKQTAITLLVVTRGFTKFDNVKQLASYAGVAPFDNSSGKRTNPDHTSSLCHKPLKAILYMCALGTIKTKEDLSAYYHQKRKEGKKHRVVMNAVSNKILQRIWSVVINQKNC